MASVRYRRNGRNLLDSIYSTYVSDEVLTQTSFKLQALAAVWIVKTPKKYQCGNTVLSHIRRAIDSSGAPTYIS